MAKYIDAEAALRCLELAGAVQTACTAITDQVLDIAGEKIANLPAADVEPVVHAHWFLRGGLFRCSHCDAKAAWERKGGTGGFSWEFEQSKAPYCPSCGARMDETT